MCHLRNGDASREWKNSHSAQWTAELGESRATNRAWPEVGTEPARG